MEVSGIVKPQETFQRTQNERKELNEMGRNLKGKELGQGLSQRKDGLYQARLQVNGRRVEHYSHDLEECRKWLNKKRVEADMGREIASAKITMDEYFVSWMDCQKSSAHVTDGTRQVYRNRYRFNISPIVGNLYLSELRRSHCQRVIDAMVGSYARKTISLTRVTLGAMLNDAVRDGIIDTNPSATIVLPRIGLDEVQEQEKKREKKFLTASEEMEFLEYAKDSSFYDLFVFMLNTGLRAGEACALRHGDIDMDKGEIRVSRACNKNDDTGEIVFHAPKTAAGIRTVPLSKDAADAITRQAPIIERKRARCRRKEADWDNPAFDDLIFRTMYGHAYTGRDINAALLVVVRHINKARENAAMAEGTEYVPFKKISAHCLRHTFASKCARKGMNPKTLQAIMGHSSITITMDIYAHADTGAMKEEFAEIFPQIGGGVKVE